jgi:hypothetical protein
MYNDFKLAIFVENQEKFVSDYICTSQRYLNYIVFLWCFVGMLESCTTW